MTTEKWSYQGFALRLEDGFSHSETRAVLDRVLESEGDRVKFVMDRPEPPDPVPVGEIGPRFLVKAEFRRPDQPLAKRLRRSRAIWEGYGLREFLKAGLPVPRLHMFGEQSRLRPRAGAVVCTRRIRARDASRLYLEAVDVEVGERVAATLALVHARGLTHGDAVLRSFLPTPEKVWVVDVSRWGRATPERRAADLALLLGSALEIGADHAHCLRLLRAYSRAPETPDLRFDRDWEMAALDAAEECRHHLEERDRTRVGRHARRTHSLRAKQRGGADRA